MAVISHRRPKSRGCTSESSRSATGSHPSVSSASGKATTVGPSGVKMTGPYEYVAPSFWYLDTKYRGAYGFNMEPVPAIPPIESILRMLTGGSSLASRFLVRVPRRRHVAHPRRVH